MAAVREALGKFNITPSLDFTSETHIEIPQISPQATPIAMPRLQVNPAYNPFKQSAPHKTQTQHWEKLYSQPIADTTASSEEPVLFHFPAIDQSIPIMQWQNKYIIVPSSQGLMMVHPHRAHMAILYKEMLALLSQHKGVSQQLLFPEVIELPPEDLHTLQALQDDLSAIGFGLDQLSPNAYTITSIPMQLGQTNPCETLLQVIHQVQDTGSTATQQWHEAMALALADKMAIPMGKALSDAEMHDLLTRLHLNHPAQYLSNGQTIFIILTPDEIQRRF